MAVLVGVGGVGQQQADALVAGDRADAGQVGEAAVDRGEVELEVAGVQDHALRGVERGGEAVGHRVGDGDELHVERADHAALAVGDRDELGAVEQPGLLDAVAGQAEGERRAVDRERQLAQQERQAADVVLVAVGGDAAVDAVGVLAQVGEVGQHQVDPEHVEVGEHQPAVDEHDLAVELDAGAVAPDLAEAAEEGDLDGVSATGLPPLACGLGLGPSALLALFLLTSTTVGAPERSFLESGAGAHREAALARPAGRGPAASPWWGSGWGWRRRSRSRSDSSRRALSSLGPGEVALLEARRSSRPSPGRPSGWPRR